MFIDIEDRMDECILHSKMICEHASILVAQPEPMQIRKNKQSQDRNSVQLSSRTTALASSRKQLASVWTRGGQVCEANDAD